MASGMDKLAKELRNMMSSADERKPKPYDAQAEVLRIEDNIAWVHIPGGVEETPVRLTINAKKGDMVNIHVANGSAWITGNGTNPPTDDTTANYAKETAIVANELSKEALTEAESAHEAADKAWAYADSAHDAADAAWTEAERAYGEAERATGYANDSLAQLGVVEDVTGTLNWITTHATYKLTEDTEVHAGKWYFIKSGDVYTVVINPTGNPSQQGWYEIDTIDEAVSNYISSHLALTNEGLWVTNDSSSYKILLANNGMKVYDNAGHLVSTFGESIIFDSARPQTIGNQNTYIKWYDSDNDHVADAIEIAGSNVSIASSVQIGGMPSDISDLTDDEGLIPTDLSDLTDDDGLIPTDLSDLTDTTGVIPDISGKADATDAVAKTQRIYYRSSSSTKPTAYPSAWVTEEGNKWNSNNTTASGWSRKVTPISNGTGSNVTKYLYLWTATQKQLVSGTVPTLTANDIALDDSTTVIDGGTIVTGTVNANSINASSGTFNTANIPNLDAGKITTGNLSADVIKTNVINAVNNGNGKISADKINVGQITVGDLSDGSSYSTTTQMEAAINSAVEGIEIGGKNLLRNTYAVIPTVSIATRGSFSITSTTYNVDVAEWGANNATTIVGSGCTDKIPLIMGGSLTRLTTPFVIPQAGDQFTFSIYIRNNHASNNIKVSTNWKAAPAISVTIAPGESKLAVISAAAGGSSNLQVNFVTDTDGAEVNITVWHPQLERGTTATNWSIASEDQQGASGRNLLRGTSECNMINGGNTWANASFFRSNYSSTDVTEIKSSYELTRDSLTSPVTGIKKCFKLVPDSIGNNRGFGQDAVPLNKGWYTLSAWVKGNTNDSVTLRVYLYSDTTKNWGNNKTITLTSNDWTFVSWTAYNPTQANVSAGYCYTGVRTVGHATYVMAMKLEQGCVPTAWTPAPEDSDPSIYDGRNLLAGSADDTSAYTVYAGPDFNFIEPLEVGTCVYITANVTVTSGIKAIAFFHSGGTIYFRNVGVVYRGDNTTANWTPVNEGTQTVAFAARVESGMDTQTSGLGYGYLRIYKSSSTSGGQTDLTGSVKVNWIKIEKGFRSSDWNTPTESYITATDKDGIKVHASNNVNLNYAKINADGLEVYKGGNSVAKFGQTVVLSDGTKTLYEIKPLLNGAAKVTRVYNMLFSDDPEPEPYYEEIMLGRTVNTWTSIVVKYKTSADGSVLTKTYTSLSTTASTIINETNFKFALEVWFGFTPGTTTTDKSRIRISVNKGATLTSSEKLTIVSIQFNFNTTQTSVESTLGAYADDTQSAVFRVGNGLSTSSKSNAFAVDYAGNGFFYGDIYADCEPDSSGGVSLGRVKEIPSAYYGEGSNWELNIGVYQIGMICMLDIYMYKNASTAAGNNIFDVDINATDIPMPAGGYGSGMMYYNNVPLGLRILDLGDGIDTKNIRFRVRNCGTSAVTVSSSSDGASGTWVYICEPTTAANYY